MPRKRPGCSNRLPRPVFQSSLLRRPRENPRPISSSFRNGSVPHRTISFNSLALRCSIWVLMFIWTVLVSCSYLTYSTSVARCRARIASGILMISASLRMRCCVCKSRVRILRKPCIRARTSRLKSMMSSTESARVSEAQGLVRSMSRILAAEASLSA